MRLATSLSIAALWAAPLALSLSGCSGLPQAYCELAAECDDAAGLLLDPVRGSSDDNAAVCAVNQQTALDALRANREDVCHDLALAREAWMACAIEEGCEAFEIGQNECKDELEEIGDLADEAGNRCNE